MNSHPVYPQESRSVAIAKPFEMNEIEKALKAAIKEDLVCVVPDSLCFYDAHPSLYVVNVPPYVCLIFRKVWR